MKKWLVAALVFFLVVGLLVFIKTHGPGSQDDVVTQHAGASYTGASMAPGEMGEADPAVLDAEGAVYGAVSVLRPSTIPGNPWVVDIELVRSTNGGTNWARIRTVAQGKELPSANITLQQETATLVEDSSDTSAPYKLIWNSYVMKNGEVDKSRSWFAIKEASSIAGPYTNEVKLLAGSLYDPSNAISPGAPEISLSSVVGECPQITEPTALSSPDGFYLAFSCINEAAAKVSVPLLKITKNGDNYTAQSLGDLLSPDDAAKFRVSYAATYPSLQRTIVFAEPDLFSKNGNTYLMVTPLVPPNTRGCLVFQVESLERGTLVRNSDGAPKVISYISGDVPNAHRGACTYSPGTTASGVIMSEVIPPAAPPPHPHLIDTGVQIP